MYGLVYFSLEHVCDLPRLSANLQKWQNELLI